MKDALGARMKERYELRARTALPRRTYTIIRLDGKAFHTYTKGLDKPYDVALMRHMAILATRLCEQIQGTAFAYQQSDEISLLLTDFAKNETEAWFDGQVQKMVSVSASIATAEFNHLRRARGQELALFDSRVFTIPDPVEVMNYFIWRQQDATKNSITMLAQKYFSAKELQGKNGAERQEMLFDEFGVDWNKHPEEFKRGILIHPVLAPGTTSYMDKRSGETKTVDFERRVWKADGAPIFRKTADLGALVPAMGEEA